MFYFQGLYRRTFKEEQCQPPWKPLFSMAPIKLFGDIFWGICKLVCNETHFYFTLLHSLLYYLIAKMHFHAFFLFSAIFQISFLLMFMPVMVNIWVLASFLKDNNIHISCQSMNMLLLQLMKTGFFRVQRRWTRWIYTFCQG